MFVQILVLDVFKPVKFYRFLDSVDCLICFLVKFWISFSNVQMCVWRHLLQSWSMVCPLPLYHVFGCVGNLVLATIFGAKLVLPSERFEAEALLKAIQDEKVVTVSGKIHTQQNGPKQTVNQSINCSYKWERQGNTVAYSWLIDWLFVLVRFVNSRMLSVSRLCSRILAGW